MQTGEAAFPDCLKGGDFGDFFLVNFLGGTCFEGFFLGGGLDVLQ